MFNRITSHVGVLVLCSIVGCSATDADAPQASAGASGQAQSGGSSGGVSGSGGISSAGSLASGGDPGVAGTTGSDGAAGAGAAAGSESAAGAGGAVGTGGAGGTSGAGGAGGTSGAGGAGGAPPYDPCPTNGDPCRIMPLGDSITQGVGSSNGGSYRVELFRLSLTNQKELTFVGSAEGGPDMVQGMTFPKHHEGHSGWTIDDGGGRSGLYPKIQGWLVSASPHIVTLMIGTNDMNVPVDPDQAPTRLGLLLDRIFMYAPNTLVVVAQIVPSTDNALNQRIMKYNAAIPAIVAARADAGKHITMVDMYTAFSKNADYKSAYMNDTLHPKDAGYVVMANTWYERIGSLLKP